MRNIRYQTLSAVSRASTGGQAAPVELLRAVKTHALLFECVADVTITGAAGGTVNAEGMQRLISLLQLKENGKTTVEVTGQYLGYLTGRAGRQAANIDTLANANAQANTILRANFVLDFASIFGANPTETCYVERDARFPTQLVFTFPDATGAQSALISGTGLTLNSFTVTVTQMCDPISKVMPFFLPRIRRTTSNAVVGTQTAFKILLYPEGNNRVQTLTLHSKSDGATSTAMLNGNVTVRGDKVRFWDAIPYRTLLAEMRRASFFPAPTAGYLELPQRSYGKLSECFVASQDDNWRAEVDAVIAGTTAVFDAYTHELESVPGYTRNLPANW